MKRAGPPTNLDRPVDGIEALDTQLVTLNAELEARVSRQSAELSELNRLLQESEVSLRKTELLYRQAEEMGRIGHWEWDETNDELASCSDQYPEILGLSRDELFSKYNTLEAYLRLVHPEDRDRVNYEVRLARTSCLPLEIEYRIVTQNGDLRFLNERSNVSTDEKGNVVSAFGTTQDISARKSVEFELLKNQALYKHAEKLGQIGHWEWDEVAGCMLGFSDQYARIFDITMVERLAESSRQNRDLDGIHPDDLARLRESELAALQNAAPLDIEYRYICSDGKLKHIRQISDVIVDESGRVIRTYGIVQDITDRKNAELEQQKHREMFEHAERLGRLGHWEWDELEGRLLSCSPQYADIFGLSQDAIMEIASDIDGRLSLVHEDDRELVHQVQLDCLENAAPMNLSYRIVTRSGELRYVRQLASLELDDAGRVVRSFGTLQDVTRQKEVELQLRKRQAMFERAEKLGQLGHWEWDEVEGRLVSCSRQYAEIFAMSRDEMITSACNDDADLALVHPDDRLHRRQMDIYRREMGAPTEFEYRIVAGNGQIRYVHQSADVELDADGKTVRSFGTLRDISEQKAVELKLRERQTMFERAEQLGKLGHWEWDEEASCLAFCSAQYAGIFGMSVDEMMTRAASTDGDLLLVHPDDRDYVRQAEKQMYLARIPTEIEYRVVRADGKVRHVRQTGDVVLNDAGTTTRSFGTLQDITELKESELQLREQQDKFRKAERIGNIGHWEWDVRKDRLIYCSEQYASIYERTVEECLQLSSSLDNDCQHIHPDDRERYRRFHYDSRSVDAERGIEVRLLTGKGNVRVIHEITRPVYDRDEQLIRTMGTVQDITERVEVASKLNESQKQFKHIFNNAPIGMALISLQGNIIELNQAAADVIGYAQDQSAGVNFTALTHPDDMADSRQRLRDMISGQLDHYNLQRRFRRRDGQYIWIDLKCSLVRDTQGQPSYFIAQGIDITEQRDLSAKLNYQASHDSLTDLINRRELESRMNRMIESARSHGHTHSFCYMDLDQFKIINDTFGHAAGDELLRQLCGLIQRSIRSRDTLARLGGDEFGLLMEHCQMDDALKMAESLRNSINEFRFIWNDKVLGVGVSMGIVAIDDNSGTSDDLMKAADSACYMAKDQGRNRIRVYAETDKDTKIRRSQMQWAAKIQEALQGDQLYLVAQPIEELGSRKQENSFYELLLRISDDKGNLVSALAMLLAAERFGLITKIDEWVFEKACSSILSDPVQLEKTSLCSINLSGQSITDMEFLEFVEDTVERFRIPPGKICFEITETSAISNFSNASKFMERLRSRGFYFALDDFGTGLSSFTYLKKLPVDYIKIDGAFIRDIHKDPTNMALVKSINELGHVFGKRTIAEYVESPKLLEVVRSIGIDFAQGYCIGMPETVTRKTVLKSVS